MINDERLIYLPLGGAGEIGMNMYIYGYGSPGREKLIMIDIGVTFPQMDSSPGVELIMPDTKFIEENIERLEGIFITHAHEDHIGALGHLIEKVNVPIFCLNFTSSIASKKIEKAGFGNSSVNIVKDYQKKINLGPFSLKFIEVPHSIPEASAILIKTPKGKILHTGDLKLDKEPVLGNPFNEKIFKEIGNEGLLALVCDSTNIFNNNSGRSETSLIRNLDLLMKQTKGVLVATTFASNIARLITLANVAKENGRSLLVLGRAMITMINNAKSCGILKKFPPILSAVEANEVSRRNLLILATGSQGEYRAASAQLSRDKYMGIELQKGDVFLFSSKTIPGNEIAVNKIINNLVSKGIEVIDENLGKYHVSGHANKPDLSILHEATRPKVLIPMHGELRHLKAHADLAEKNGIRSKVILNGDLTEIDVNGRLNILEQVKCGRIYLDGNCLLESQNNVVKKRLDLAMKGIINISIIINEIDYKIEDVWIKTIGVSEKDIENNSIDTSLEEELEYYLNSLSQKSLKNDDEIDLVIRKTVNRFCKNNLGKKPVISSFIHRI